MNPNERIQELESRNIRLMAQHRKDVELLISALSALTKAKIITQNYEILTTKMQKLNDEIMEDWKETIGPLNKNFLTGILVGILLLMIVQVLAEIFLK